MTKTANILVVEDSPTQLEKLSICLEEAGFSVVAAADGMEGLAAARANAIDLVISDVMMPEMDGHALCRALRADETLSHLPVILLTSLSDPRDVIRGLESGATSFICKPCDDRALLERVREILANQKVRKAAPGGTGDGVFYAGQWFNITADRQQILDLLLSTYENAVRQNAELTRARDELRILNERLETLIAERTASLTAEIGERERGEEELRFRNLILSTQQEVSIDGMLVVDVVGKIISSNRRFAEMWGIPPDIIESGSDERALQFVMDKLANPEEFIRKVKFLYANAGEKSKEEVSLKDGRTFDRYSAPLLGAGGEYLGRVWYFSDVTEHKQALEGLRFSNARLQALWSVSSGDHADSEMVANEIITAIVQMTGSEYGFYDLVGMDESVLTIQGLFGEAMAGCSVADKRKQYRIDQVGVWAEAVRRRAPFIMNDYSAPHAGKKGLPEGHVPIKRILVVPHFSSGKITAVAAVANKAIDYTEDDARQMTAFLAGIQVISDRKRAEEERKKLEDQLRVAQKMEAIGSLAGGVAHDFNNMLGVILGHADLALMTLGPDQPLSGALREIRSAAERSANLTRQLLAFARKQTVAPRVLDLNEAMEGMLKMLRRLIGEDVELSWLPGAGLWPVRVDPSQIDQVMANLCVNARDAIDGVGRIGIETGNAVLDAGYCAAHRGAVPGEYVRITVSDSGCGMDGNVKEHLFEPFFTTKEKSKGTGLGLATVYGIVKQNNGYISIDSEPGRGSTFSIYLPRHVGKVEPVPAQDPAEPALRGRETILLVEDEPANLKLTREMLERQGYTALPAGTPGEADRIAAEHAGEIHLLVTDVVLPGMNGRELARKLQSLHPHLKCLFISGYTADIIVHQGVLDEGIHFLAKPFTAAVLARKVREVLDDGAGLAEGQEKAV